MAAPEQINPAIEKLFLAKNKRRHSLAAMSYSEKVRALVQLQRMAYPILKNRNKHACVWQIDNREG
jgi:hypothetical protein